MAPDNILGEIRELYLLDVFAEERYAGNQLAVVRNARHLDNGTKQKIAKEINFSETTFILSDESREGGYDVQIFTPKEEVPFAGHPVLGTAFIILEEIIKEPADAVVLNLPVGPIPVQRDSANGEVLWMKQPAPSFTGYDGSIKLSEVLGIEPGEIEGDFPIEEVSTGLPFIVVPVKTLSALKRIRVSLPLYYELIGNLKAKAIIAFSKEPYSPSSDISARVFADYFGVPEDAATGSANGCLAGYLLKNDFFRGRREVDVRVEQGVEIGRPSLIRLKADWNNADIDIRVGGKIIPVGKGILS